MTVEYNKSIMLRETLHLLFGDSDSGKVESARVLKNQYRSMLGAPDREGSIQAPDGQEIRWYGFGLQKGAVPLLCCNGIGCSVLFWRYLVAGLKQQREIILWDYRGHGLSANPQLPDPISIEDNAADALAVLKDTGHKKAVFLGHSMGSQVILDVFRQSPKAVSALIPVLGAYGSPLHTFMGTDLAAKAFPTIHRISLAVPTQIEKLSARMAAIPALKKLASITGIINGKLMSDEDFFAYITHIARIDVPLFMNMLLRLSEHSAESWLRSINVPVLIVAGSDDLFTPHALSEQMLAEIQHSEMLTIPAGSHAALVEQPELMNLRVEQFLRNRVDTKKSN